MCSTRFHTDEGVIVPAESERLSLPLSVPSHDEHKSATESSSGGKIDASHVPEQ